MEKVEGEWCLSFGGMAQDWVEGEEALCGCLACLPLDFALGG